MTTSRELPAVNHPERGAHLVYDGATESMIGRDTRGLRAPDMAKMGIEPISPMAAIRQNCIDCSGGAPVEVRRCGNSKCPFWPFRLGHNPFRQPKSDAFKAAAGERMRAMQAAKRGETSTLMSQEQIDELEEDPDIL